MQLRKSNRSQAKIRIALQGPSGSGKSYSSLLLAYGLCKDWSKIAVVDSENQSADLYAHLGSYNVLNLLPPYSPERYMEAISQCEKAGMEVIIIDSLTHEWEGEGGILDIHGKMAGNSFSNWAKITPRHNALVQKILSSNCHIVATVRTKQDYVITEKNGKQVPEKVGLKAVQRDGMEYDFSIVFEIDIHHQVNCTKDRTQLFAQKFPFQIDFSTGEKIKSWCDSGDRSSPIVEKLQVEDPIEAKIQIINNLDQLYQYYRETPDKNRYLEAFSKRAEEIRKLAVAFNPFITATNGRA